MKNYGEFDYVIVGAGAAGCVLANRLSANPKVSVLLLEAGKKDNWIWTHIPVGYLYCINNPRTDWCYKTQPEAGLNGRSIIYARGKGLGGSTLINAMLYLRGQARDYDQWAQMTGDDSWSWNKVKPFFIKSENHHGGQSEHHGADGEWRVEQARVRWDVLDRFKDALGEAGINATDDFNQGDNFGASPFEVNQRKGWRWSANKGFLNPIINRPNLTIVSGALTDKLIMDGKACKGVYFSIDGKPCQVTSKIETILAAGSIGSPNILERSGIGQQSLLQQHGIPVVHHNPNVGENLQDHLQLRCVYKVTGIHTLNQQANSLIGKMKMGLQFALFQTGPLTMAPSQLGAFAYSSPDVATPDLEYHVQPLSLDKFGDPVHSFPAMTASVCNLRPYSRGHVHIASSSPSDAPLIAPCYLSHPKDVDIAIKSIRITRNVVSQPSFAKYKPEEYLPGSQFETEAQLAEAAGNIGTTIFHPVGTCKMGKVDDPTAVVDTRLKVIGIQGLRVVDASIMPTITSGNTSSPTIMIAERGSEMILEDWQRTVS